MPNPMNNRTIPILPILIAALLCTLLIPGTLTAQAGWEPAGLRGNVVAVTFNQEVPDALYAATAGPAGVHHSANRGQSWRAISEGLAVSGDPLPAGLLFQARRSHFLFLATPAGPWISQDGGAAWKEHIEGLPEGRSRSSLSFAVIHDRQGDLLVGTSSGLFRSTRATGPWQPVTAGLPPVTPEQPAPAITALVSSLQDRNHVFMALGDGPGGVWGSSDSGTTWKPMSQGLPPGAPVQRLLQPANDPYTLLAVTADGLYLSDDGAENWRRIHEGPVGAIGISDLISSLIAIAPPGGTFLYTRDSGETWQTVPGTLPGGTIHGFYFSPAATGTIYAATSGGLHKRVLFVEEAESYNQ